MDGDREDRKPKLTPKSMTSMTIAQALREAVSLYNVAVDTNIEMQRCMGADYPQAVDDQSGKILGSMLQKEGAAHIERYSSPRIFSEKRIMYVSVIKELALIKLERDIHLALELGFKLAERENVCAICGAGHDE